MACLVWTYDYVAWNEGYDYILLLPVGSLSPCQQLRQKPTWCGSATAAICEHNLLIYVLYGLLLGWKGIGFVGVTSGHGNILPVWLLGGFQEVLQLLLELFPSWGNCWPNIPAFSLPPGVELRISLGMKFQDVLHLLQCRNYRLNYPAGAHFSPRGKLLVLVGSVYWGGV